MIIFENFTSEHFMKKLLKFLSPYKKESVLGPLFKLLEASFELFVPLVVAAIIDVGIAQNDKKLVLTNCAILLALAIIGLICAVTAQYFAAKAAVGFAKGVRHALFSHIGKLSYTDIDRLGTSTLITRMTSDVTQVQSGVNLTLRLLLRSPFVVVGAAVMAFTVDPKAALVFLITLPVVSAVVFGIMFFCVPLYKKVQSRLDAVTKTTRENLAGVRVLRAFRHEKKEIDAFDQRNTALTGEQIHVGRISALLNPLSLLLINLAIVALIYVGAIRVDNGELSQGSVVALYNYMSQILVELIKFASLVITLTKAIACGNRIESVLAIEPTMEENLNEITAVRDSEAAVSFANVTARYQGAGDASLRGVSFSAKRGETIGIIGGTGSGKTTLVNLIPRFYDAAEGEISVLGMPVKEWNSATLREHIGIVPQKAVLFHGTIRDNLAWGKADATDEELFEALRLAQAEDVVRSKEDGLDSMVEQGGRNFSGGQRQRLTIARALVRRPDILILDDSSSALDYATDAALRRSLHTLQEEYHPTVFIVSQRTSSLRHADQILVLDEGEVVGMGRHDQLLQSCRVYREIHESQYQEEEA
jgi:ABC-type multidrug transport system fused ATPase/permease subunit